MHDQVRDWVWRFRLGKMFLSPVSGWKQRERESQFQRSPEESREFVAGRFAKQAKRVERKKKGGNFVFAPLLISNIDFTHIF